MNVCPNTGRTVTCTYVNLMQVPVAEELLTSGSPLPVMPPQLEILVLQLQVSSDLSNRC